MDSFIYPYKSASKSVKDLAAELGIKVMKRQGSNVADKAKRLIINWGASDCPTFKNAHVLNKAQAVAKAANKLATFIYLEAYNENEKKDGHVNFPEFTTSKRVAQQWMEEGIEVCSRAVLDSNNGKGLVISKNPADHPDKVPLYTKYIPKMREYRVHVIDNTVVAIQRKVWPNNKPKDGIDFKQRNFDDGFVFQKELIKDLPTLDIITQAKLACKALGLDFAGVDVIWTKSNNKATVLEVNTAPGIEGSDIKVYGNSFRDIYKTVSE